MTSGQNAIVSPYLNFDPAYVTPVSIHLLQTSTVGFINIIFVNTCIENYVCGLHIIFQNADSQFIFPEGGGGRRGRFELAFSQIGGSVFVGMSFYSRPFQ